MKKSNYVIDDVVLATVLHCPDIQKLYQRYIKHGDDQSMRLLVNQIEIMLSGMTPSLSEVTVRPRVGKETRLVKRAKELGGFQDAVRDALARVQRHVMKNPFAKPIQTSDSQYGSFIDLCGQILEDFQLFQKATEADVPPRDFAYRYIELAIHSGMFNAKRWTFGNFMSYPVRSYVQTRLREWLMILNHNQPEHVQEIMRWFNHYFEFKPHIDIYAMKEQHGRFVQALEGISEAIALTENPEDVQPFIQLWVHAQYEAYTDFLGDQASNPMNLSTALGFLVGKPKDGTNTATMRFQSFVQELLSSKPARQSETVPPPDNVVDLSELSEEW